MNSIVRMLTSDINAHKNSCVTYEFSCPFAYIGHLRTYEFMCYIWIQFSVGWHWTSTHIWIHVSHMNSFLRMLILGIDAHTNSCVTYEFNCPYAFTGDWRAYEFMCNIRIQLSVWLYWLSTHIRIHVKHMNSVVRMIIFWDLWKYC